MSVSNKTNYNKNEKYWKKKTCQLPHIFNIVCHNFQCDIVQKAYVKIPSKLGFVTIFLQVYKYFFCSKTNRQSLR